MAAAKPVLPQQLQTGVIFPAIVVLLSFVGADRACFFCPRFLVVINSCFVFFRLFSLPPVYVLTFFALPSSVEIYRLFVCCLWFVRFFLSGPDNRQWQAQPHPLHGPTQPDGLLEHLRVFATKAALLLLLNVSPIIRCTGTFRCFILLTTVYNGGCN